MANLLYGFAGDIKTIWVIEEVLDAINSDIGFADDEFIYTTKEQRDNEYEIYHNVKENENA